MQDPILCCETVGLQTPLSALRINHPIKDSQESCEYLEVSLDFPVINANTNTTTINYIDVK